VVSQHYVATTFSAAPTAIQLPRAAGSKERPLSRQNLVNLSVSFITGSRADQIGTHSGFEAQIKCSEGHRRDINCQAFSGVN
jgi:hypothetical protein